MSETTKSETWEPIDMFGAPMHTTARINMRMGGWLWGYPRGHRIGVVDYCAAKRKDGLWVWRSQGSVCDGLTAANTADYCKAHKDAFCRPIGSLHNVPVSESDLADVAEQLMALQISALY